MEQNNSTYRQLLARINEAQDKATLNKLDARITRHYNAGTISATELKRLDVRIMERLAQAS